MSEKEYLAGVCPKCNCLVEAVKKGSEDMKKVEKEFNEKGFIIKDMSLEEVKKDSGLCSCSMHSEVLE
jgi:hypothetical protein